MGFNKAYKDKHNKRFERTLNFLKASVAPPANLLDLGAQNPFTAVMEEAGYKVTNTPEAVDLDLDFSAVESTEYDVVTAFEIFEHLVAPFNLLRAIKAPYLVASVPLKLWFADAYWNESDPWDRHYHEFESRQFDMLLEKSGWKILRSQKWASPVSKLGIRPILRRFTPRYYIVFCERLK